MFPWKKHLLIVWIHYSADKSSAWLYCWCYYMSPYLRLWRLLSSAGSGPLRIQTLGRVPQSVINEGGDRQAGCILITHKDKEWYGEEERENTRKQKRVKLILHLVWHDVTACALVKILFWGLHNSEHLPSAVTHRNKNIRRHSGYSLGLRNKQRDMKNAEGAFWGWPSPVDQEKLAHLVAHCNTHKASRSWLFMPLNLALKIKLLSCAVIVDLVGIIYANVKVSLWILIVTDRENYSSQVEKMQEDWLGVTLKRKSPPTAGLSYYTDHIKHLKNCVYCVRRCWSLFHSLVWETGSHLKLESASLPIDSSSFRHVSPCDITERGRPFSDKRLDFSRIWLII